MVRLALILFVAAAVVIASGPGRAEPLALDGASLTPRALVAAARSGRPVAVAEPAWRTVRDAHAVLIAAAEQCQQIYGLTTGVGANKDRSELGCADLLDAQGRLSEATIAASRRFNQALLHAHSAGVAPEMPPEIVRAVLMARLNTALTGGSGMHENVVRRFADYLNHDILPVIPGRGSMGEADITLLAHVGLTMGGEWFVDHRGERMPAGEALAAAGLEPIRPFGKDALASFSSNAYSAALAAFALEELRHVAHVARLVYAISLEGLNGNVAPILPEPAARRPFPHVEVAAGELRAILEGSYLFEPSDGRPLQDPLSYRTAAYQLGSLDRALAELEALLAIQLNSPDDNPVVHLGPVSALTASQAVIKPVSRDGLEGAVVPSGNFSPLPYVIAMQRAAVAGAHVSQASLLRTIKLADPHFTGLSRFLGTENTTHAFGAIQKPIVELAAENRALANPVSLDFMPVALGIEDVATNAPRVARRLRRMADNLIGLLGFELMHAAQAVDLRLRQNPDLALSPVTRALLAEYREHVPFLDRDDQVLTENIAASAAFLQSCRTAPEAGLGWRAAAEAGAACVEAR